MMKALIPALALLILNLTDGAAPTKEKYVYSAKNVYASFNWTEEEDCLKWTYSYGDGDYVYFRAAEEVSKVQDDGKPETSKHSYVDARFNTYYECNDTNYKRKWVSVWNETPTVAIKDNLKSAFVSSTGEGWVTYEVCGTFECEDGECYTCDWTIPESVYVTLTATVVATGTPKKTKSGTSVDATVSTFTFTVGEEQPIPPDLPSDYTYAYIAKTKKNSER